LRKERPGGEGTIAGEKSRWKILPLEWSCHKKVGAFRNVPNDGVAFIGHVPGLIVKAGKGEPCRRWFAGRYSAQLIGRKTHLQLKYA
jgi:hypothetical protein